MSLVAAPSPIPTVRRTVVTNLTPSYNTAEELMELLRSIRNRDALQTVDLERKRLPDSYVRAILDASASNPHVLRVRLHRVGINDHHSKLLIKLLRSNLVDLDLAKNRLTDAAAIPLFQSLPTSSVRRLVLEGNLLTNESIQVLCDILPETRIEILKIGKHELDVRCFAAVLRSEKCGIRKLDLRSCSGNGWDTVIPTLAENRSLEYLCMGRNQLDNSCLQGIAKALQHNKSLQVLDLQYNDFDDGAIRGLLDCLTVNNTLQKIKLRHCDKVSDLVKEELLAALLLNAHGPELAQKTKIAERHIFEDESESSTECVICFETAGPCALLPCKHRNCCMDCAVRLYRCHMCRETVVKILPHLTTSTAKDESK